MQAYDLPGSIAPSFVTMPRHQLPWLLHAPLKLLVHVGGCCTSPIVDGGKFSSVVDWPEDTAGSHVDKEETVGQFSSAVNLPARPPGLGRCSRVERQASSFEGLAIANQRAATTTQGATTPTRLDTTQDTTTLQHETATRLEAPYGSMTQGELETWLQQQAKAVKADDAANPTYLWDERVWAITHDEAR